MTPCKHCEPDEACPPMCFGLLRPYATKRDTTALESARGEQAATVEQSPLAMIPAEEILNDLVQ